MRRKMEPLFEHRPHHLAHVIAGWVAGCASFDGKHSDSHIVIRFWDSAEGLLLQLRTLQVVRKDDQRAKLHVPGEETARRRRLLADRIQEVEADHHKISLAWPYRDSVKLQLVSWQSLGNSAARSDVGCEDRQIQQPGSLLQGPFTHE